MPSTFVLGPCFAFYGNPTTAAGADMKYLGETDGDVTVSLNVRTVSTRSDQTGGTALADGTYDLGPDPEVSIPLIDQDIDKIVAILLASEKVTGTGAGALNLGSGVRKIVPDTLCLVPTFQKAQGKAASHALWLPAANCTNPGALTYRLPQGETASVPRTATFRGLYRAKDQATTSIPEKARIAFLGDPASNGLTWYLPGTLPDGTTIGS